MISLTRRLASSQREAAARPVEADEHGGRAGGVISTCLLRPGKC